MDMKDLVGKIDVFSEEYSFGEYLEKVKKNKKLVRTAHQRLYDMIVSHGTKKIKDAKKEITKYHFFSDLKVAEGDTVFGTDLAIMKMVNVFKSAAMGYGPEKRVILLHGPVGAAKSTLVRQIKKGLSEYSKISAGIFYTFVWVSNNDREAEKILGEKEFPCPMHEEPLHLIPKGNRKKVAEYLGLKEINKNLCPACKQIFDDLAKRYDGDFEKITSHIKIKRLILDEETRMGIGTFQPKDEKNQDSTELNGDVNYRKIAQYGSDSDPRAFNFDGEFHVANRGIIEFVEVLKLEVAFLYDLLTASQEHKIKPKKFAQTDIDEVIIGHTNEPEYKKLQSNEFMEALKDRTIKIDIPYVTKLDEEIKIYEKDFNKDKVKKHIAPHTIEMAAMWAILTRLEEPKKAQITLLQKLKLYNGKTLPGFTEDNIKELRKEAVREAMDGISPRYIQDKISNALVNFEENCVHPFMILNELESGLKHHSLINSEDKKKYYKSLVKVVQEEFEDIVKNEVQKAICMDEEAIQKLCGNYIDNIKAYTQREKVKNKYTGQDEAPDEQLMRAVEEKIEISENRKDDFRREIMNYIGALAIEKKTFDYKSNERLTKALELKLFEDSKDSIKLTSIISSEAIDKSQQEKIDVVKKRLIDRYGYCEVCATDTLNYVASIFARGDIKNKK